MFLGFGVGAQGWGLKLFVEVVDIVERFFVGVCPFVVFFLRLILGVVDLRLGVLGLIVFPEGAVHIDRPDFQGSLPARRDRQDEQ